MTTLEAALTYRRKGYSVIPVGPDKRPLVSWKDYQDRKATVEEVIKWWTQFPEALVGIVTGVISNLTVIDVEEGGDFGIVTDKTFTVKTGGGGRHFFFQYDPDFKTGARILHLTDVRSQGGYVVAAPSRSQKGAYEVLVDTDVIQMSPETKKRLLGDSGASQSVFTDRNMQAQPQSGQFPKFDVLNALNVSQGGRNETLHKLAVSLLNHYDQHEAWGLVAGANATYKPPLPDNEVRILFNSAMKFVKDNPKKASAPRVWGPSDPHGTSKTATHSGEVRHAAAVAGEMSETEEKHAEILHAAEVAKLQDIDSEVVFPMNMPPFDDALLGGFSPGDLVLMAGRSGNGKTTVIQDWSVTLASGGLEKKNPLPCLWFSYEVLARPLWKKFETMGATADTPIYLPSFNESGDIDWVTEMITRGVEEKGIRVVAIDHLGFLSAPKGHYANQSDAITHTVRHVKRLAVKHGLIVMLPVHVKKTLNRNPELEDIRDSSGIYQEADSVFFVERQKDIMGLPTTRARMWLVKNRKTGISSSALFDYEFGRYFYNADETKNKNQEEKDNAEALDAFDKM